MRKKNVTRRSSFTLIELLVVIGIIGILVGILLPAISSAIKEGKKTKAESDCKLIALAVAGYKNDNQTLPYADNSSDQEVGNITTEIYERLGGQTARGKVYFENNGTHLNPWDNPYQIAFDSNYSGAVDTTSFGTVAGPVAVWTEVPGSTYVYSWE